MRKDQHEPSKAQVPDFGRVAQAWEKWEQWLEPSYRSFNQLLLEKACVTAGQEVLDLGCGSGYPALLIAQSVGSSGRVIGLDVSPEMLAVARKRAIASRLSNIELQQCDVTELPFPENTFDAVTSRFCLMFVTPIEKTLGEAYRVLKPRGRIVTSVWSGPEKNLLPRAIVEQYFALPQPDVGTPGPYRFGTAGSLSRLLKHSGFIETTEEEIAVEEIFLDGRQFVEHIMEASALWGGMLRSLSPDLLEEAKQKLAEAAERHRRGDRIYIPRSARMVTGKKPHA